MATENKMGAMPEGRLIVTMSFPIMLSMLVQALYNIVDSAFVARIGEDALFNLRAVRAAQRLAYVDEPVYVYRMHAASAMHSVREGEFVRHRPFFEALRRELSAEGSRFFGTLAASMALRLYKEGGLAAVLGRFNAEARPVLRAQEARGAVAALVRAGVYPALYAAAFPLWRVWRKAMEAWRCARGRQD